MGDGAATRRQRRGREVPPGTAAYAASLRPAGKEVFGTHGGPFRPCDRLWPGRRSASDYTVRVDAAAREMTEFVEARGRRRVRAIAGLSVLSLALGTLGAMSWPQACESFAASVCHTEGESVHCMAIQDLAPDLDADVCREASEAFDQIEQMRIEQVQAYTGFESATESGWAEIRLVLKHRVAQLALRNLSPRLALQPREKFERVLRTVEAR